jgi:hypothetical protein
VSVLPITRARTREPIQLLEAVPDRQPQDPIRSECSLTRMLSGGEWHDPFFSPPAPTVSPFLRVCSTRPAPPLAVCTTVMPDEFARFLKGRVPGMGGSPPRAKSADTLNPKRQRSPRRLSHEEREMMRRREQMEAERPRRQEELRQLAKDSAVRLERLEAEKHAWEHDRSRRMQHEQLDCAYKRELLSRMRRNMIRSPIPSAGQERTIRLGSARILPLYQSERLVVHMEQHGFKQPWPGRRPYTPRPPSTTVLEEVGRAEPLLSPSWYANMAGGGGAGATGANWQAHTAGKPPRTPASRGRGGTGKIVVPKLPVPAPLERELKAVRASASMPRL